MNSANPPPPNAPSAAEEPLEINDQLLIDFNNEQKKYIIREMYPILKQTLH
jgi:hypothetical protein